MSSSISSVLEMEMNCIHNIQTYWVDLLKSLSKVDPQTILAPLICRRKQANEVEVQVSIRSKL